MSKEMKRVIWHWTAGTHTASDTDKKHYHRLADGTGKIVYGNEEVEDNIVTSDGDYAAHTLNLNTASIGVALCGMSGAVEYPYNSGNWPVNEWQFRAMAKETALLCKRWGIPVTRQTVLTHAEVEPTLGVKQRGKWDFTRIPFRPDLRGAIQCGDYIRELVRQEMGTATPDNDYPTLKQGNSGFMVRVLQENLTTAGFSVGRIDGVFGKATAAAVLDFQNTVGLTTDGKVGPKTWAKLNQQKQRKPTRDITEDELRDAGSRTISGADEGTKVTTQTGGGVATVGAIDMVMDFSRKLGEVDQLLPALQRTLMDNWPIILVIGGGLFLMYKGPEIMKRIVDARTDDAKSGRNMSR